MNDKPNASEAEAKHSDEQATESRREVQAEKGREKTKSPSSALQADGSPSSEPPSPAPEPVAWRSKPVGLFCQNGLNVRFENNRYRLVTDDELQKMLAALVRPKNELPENMRVPLHELQADVDYLIGRVVADGSCASAIANSIKEKLSAIEAASPQAQPAMDRDALVKKISSAMADGKDCGGYDTLFDMLAHISLSVIEAQPAMDSTTPKPPLPSEQRQSSEAIVEAFEAGALAVHREWLAAVDRGEEGPPRGDPDFKEAAHDYAQSLPAAPVASDEAGTVTEVCMVPKCPRGGLPFTRPAADATARLEPITLEEIRQTISDEWGSHVCYRDSFGRRSCKQDVGIVMNCRCDDIARAILSRIDGREKL